MDIGNRHFQVWQYTTSLSRLYIRSTKSAAHQKNVDVIFIGVEYMDLVTHFNGLEMAAPTEEEILKGRQLSGSSEFRPDWVRVLITGDRRSLVVAAGMSIEENDLEFHESGLEAPAI